MTVISFNDHSSQEKKDVLFKKKKRKVVKKPNSLRINLCYKDSKYGDAAEVHNVHVLHFLPSSGTVIYHGSPSLHLPASLTPPFPTSYGIMKSSSIHTSME